jgi:hypothetical protein
MTFINYLLFTQILTVPFLETNIVDSELFQSWLISGLIVYPFVMISIYLARYLFIKKYSNQIPTKFLLLCGWLVGFCKGFSTHYLANHLYIADPSPLNEMIIRGFSGGALGLFLTFAFSLKTSFQEEMLASQLIEEENTGIAKQIVDLDSEIESLKNLTKEDLVRGVLQKLRNSLDLNLLSSDPAHNWKKIATILREQTSKEVRIQSHGLADLKYKNVTSNSFLKQLWKSKNLHLHPFAFAFVQLSIGVSIVYEDWNPRGSSSQIALNFIATLVLTSIAKKVHERLHPVTPKVNHATVILLVTLNVLLQVLLSNPLGVEFNPIYIIFVIAWQMFLVYSISFVSELMIFKSEKFRELTIVQKNLIDKRRVLENYHLRLRNDVGKHLHGYLVSKVLKTSTQLDDMGRKGEFSGFSLALEELLSEFSLEKFYAGLSKDRMSEDFYKLTAEDWSGMVEVKFTGELDCFRTMHTTQRIELAEIIEELIANSHRHGGATQILIDFSWLKDGVLEILAEDNGHGVAQGFTKGLGFSLFESASDGRVSVEVGLRSHSAIRIQINLYEEASKILTKDEVPVASDQLAGHTP